MPFVQMMKRIDYVGNVLLIGSTVSEYDFTLVIGLVELGIFKVYETTSWVNEPTRPSPAIAFTVTLLNSALLYWMLFFLPVYFPAVLLSSPTPSGVYLIPIIVIAVSTAIVAVLFLTKVDRYKPFHTFDFAVSTLGLGLMTLLDENSNIATWVIISMVAGRGEAGFSTHFYQQRKHAYQRATKLPRLQRGPLHDHSEPSGTSPFLQLSLTIDSNSSPTVSPTQLCRTYYLMVERISMLPATSSSLLETQSLKTLIRVYSDALKRVWEISIVFAGVAFTLSFFEKEITLRTDWRQNMAWRRARISNTRR
ncbi:uncharacterized protein Z518_11105 [Rhinocladiella mackenziei CBS 650.93]|uniref:Uncharacterized protein n=1 Tax=Rhinocladiella mackenziei CBS 650.93 TaxID=1442369 RepID=A0A0D2GMV6_9EURO|nr:uncharacterized protein Z518_11105 [Rhinocladiella mackenziei CBS 650.93]KIW99692.1 hypothetical protein Z518_11105 [Rhinocladiella mackenziei CBS 650.93]